MCCTCEPITARRVRATAQTDPETAVSDRARLAAQGMPYADLTAGQFHPVGIFWKTYFFFLLQPYWFKGVRKVLTLRQLTVLSQSAAESQQHPDLLYQVGHNIATCNYYI